MRCDSIQFQLIDAIEITAVHENVEIWRRFFAFTAFFPIVYSYKIKVDNNSVVIRWEAKLWFGSVLLLLSFHFKHLWFICLYTISRDSARIEIHTRKSKKSYFRKRGSINFMVSTNKRWKLISIPRWKRGNFMFV